MLTNDEVSGDNREIGYNQNIKIIHSSDITLVIIAARGRLWRRRCSGWRVLYNDWTCKSYRSTVTPHVITGCLKLVKQRGVPVHGRFQMTLRRATTSDTFQLTPRCVRASITCSCYPTCNCNNLTLDTPAAIFSNYWRLTAHGSPVTRKFSKADKPAR